MPVFCSERVSCQQPEGEEVRQVIARFIVGLCLGCGVGLVFAQESLKETIQDRENQWAAAYNAHDVEQLVQIYEADAVLIPPGQRPVSGRAAIGEAFLALFPIITDLSLVADEVRALGDNYAVEIGHSVYQAVAADGSLQPTSDDYQVVWHKGQDGVWRYVTDMFNARQ